MRKLTYFAVLEKNGNGEYGVMFPGIDGCVSFGTDLQDAMNNAQEALSLHIWGMEQDGETLPAQNDNIEVDENKIIAAVSIFPDLFAEKMNSKRVRINCTIPQWIKTQAEERNINFSKVLELALKEEITV